MKKINWIDPKVPFGAKFALCAIIIFVFHASVVNKYYHYLLPPEEAGQEQMYPVTLEDPIQKWMDHLYGNDAYQYINIGNNFSKGLGINVFCDWCEPPRYTPWNSWAPGAPIIFGTTFKIARMLGFEKDMKSLYFMCWGMFFISSLIILGALCVYTQNLWAMLLAAFVLGYSPPLQDWHYGKIFANSEVGILVPLALSYLFYALGTKAFWKNQAITKRKLLYFALAGFFIGAASISRASNVSFAVVACLLFLGVVAIRLKFRFQPLLRAGILCVAFYAAFQVLPATTSLWNLARVGEYKIFDGTDWRIGIWQPYRGNGFTYSSGIGIGDYLNPEKADRLYNSSGLPRRTFSVEFLKEFAKQPIKAAMFRIKRFPLLYLGYGGPAYPNNAMPPEKVWPEFSNIERMKGWIIGLYENQFYSVLMYLFLFMYLGSCIVRKTWPPEIMYFYLIFLLIASPFVHAEFRYSFPILLIIRMATPLAFLVLMAKLGLIHVPEPQFVACSDQDLQEADGIRINGIRKVLPQRLPKLLGFLHR